MQLDIFKISIKYLEASECKTTERIKKKKKKTPHRTQNKEEK
jgi:hypothetical protein